MAHSRLATLAAPGGSAYTAFDKRNTMGYHKVEQFL